jgi:glutamate-5-semialdehyde dehydrogenase
MHAFNTASEIPAIAARSRAASRVLLNLETQQKNQFLLDLADHLRDHRAAILSAAAQDEAAAKADNLESSKLQRLTVDAKKLDQLDASLRQVALLDDPVGKVVSDKTVPSGLRVQRVRCPLGVICMIFEARPLVTIEAFALCFKSGNACILKPGKEAGQTATLLTTLTRQLLNQSALPADALSTLVFAPGDRQALLELLKQDTTIDLVIPRGGEELIRFVADNSRIPTIQHYKGVCHLYVDAGADLAMAKRLIVTGKTSAPATCNALECVLVHQQVAAQLLPELLTDLARAGVEVRGDQASVAIAKRAGHPIALATPEDFGREFLSLTLAMKIVPDLHAAIAHIDQYGSNHSESIVTSDEHAAAMFTSRIHASCVLVNASTRFNDGFQLGLGAEIGISTTKLHAYGPMGLEELTTARFIVQGNGQSR